MANDAHRTRSVQEPTTQRTPAPAPESTVESGPAPVLASVPAALAQPWRASAAAVLALQRLSGNRAVTHLIQAKRGSDPFDDDYYGEIGAESGIPLGEYYRQVLGPAPEKPAPEPPGLTDEAVAGAGEFFAGVEEREQEKQAKKLKESTVKSPGLTDEAVAGAGEFFAGVEEREQEKQAKKLKESTVKSPGLTDEAVAGAGEFFAGIDEREQEKERQAALEKQWTERRQDVIASSKQDENDAAEQRKKQAASRGGFKTGMAKEIAARSNKIPASEKAEFALQAQNELTTREATLSDDDREARQTWVQSYRKSLDDLAAIYTTKGAMRAEITKKTAPGKYAAEFKAQAEDELSKRAAGLTPSDTATATAYAAFLGDLVDIHSEIERMASAADETKALGVVTQAIKKADATNSAGLKKHVTAYGKAVGIKNKLQKKLDATLKAFTGKYAAEFKEQAQREFATQTADLKALKDGDEVGFLAELVGIHTEIGKLEQTAGAQYGKTEIRTALKAFQTNMKDKSATNTSLTEKLTALKALLDANRGHSRDRRESAQKAENLYMEEKGKLAPSTDKETSKVLERAKDLFEAVQVTGSEGITTKELEALQLPGTLLKSFSGRVTQTDVDALKAKYAAAPYDLGPGAVNRVNNDALKPDKTTQLYKNKAQLEQLYKDEVKKQYEKTREQWCQYLGYTAGANALRIRVDGSSHDGMAGHHTVPIGTPTAVVAVKEGKPEDGVADKSAETVRDNLYPSAGMMGAHFSLGETEPRPAYYRGGASKKGNYYNRAENSPKWPAAVAFMQGKQLAEETWVKDRIQHALSKHLVGCGF